MPKSRGFVFIASFLNSLTRPLNRALTCNVNSVLFQSIFLHFSFLADPGQPFFAARRDDRCLQKNFPLGGVASFLTSCLAGDEFQSPILQPGRNLSKANAGIMESFSLCRLSVVSGAAAAFFC